MIKSFIYYKNIFVLILKPVCKNSEHNINKMRISKLCYKAQLFQGNENIKNCKCFCYDFSFFKKL